MNTLKCSRCNNAISFGDFILSLSPYHIKCKKCKSSLKIKKYTKTIMILALLYGFSIASILTYMQVAFLYFIVYLAIFITLFEVLLYYVVRVFNIDLVEKEFKDHI